MVELFANSGDPDQMPHSAPSDLGVHCLPVTVLGISRVQLVKLTFSNSTIRTDRSYGVRRFRKIM